MYLRDQRRCQIRFKKVKEVNYYSVNNRIAPKRLKDLMGEHYALVMLREGALIISCNGD